MKNVLVLIHRDVGQEARLQCALDLARAVDGHLTCVDVSILPATAGDPTMFGGDAMLIEAEQDREMSNRARTEARLGDEEVPYDWRDVTGDLAVSVRDAAALADIVVLNRELEGTHFPDMVHVVGDVLIKADKPVLAVPQDVRRFNAFGHAMIAWNGSRACSEALRVAAPLLAHAERVTILEVADKTLETPAFEAGEYLSRHGIRPVICRKPASASLASDVILDEVRKGGADYLVMGGFGHSRLSQALFGGVTRDMLRACPVPLLLAN